MKHDNKTTGATAQQRWSWSDLKSALPSVAAEAMEKIEAGGVGAGFRVKDVNERRYSSPSRVIMHGVYWVEAKNWLQNNHYDNLDLRYFDFRELHISLAYGDIDLCERKPVTPPTHAVPKVAAVPFQFSEGLQWKR